MPNTEPKVINFPPEPTRLPANVYFDANFLISWHLPKHRWHLPASQLLKLLLSRKTRLLVSTLALDEAWWRLLVRFYERDYGRGTWRPDILRRHPHLPKAYEPELRGFTASLLALPRLRVVDQVNSRSLVIRALDHLRDHALAPRDAFHLAIAQAIGVPYIVTNDVRFQQIPAPWLTVITFMP